MEKNLEHEMDTGIFSVVAVRDSACGVGFGDLYATGFRAYRVQG